MGNRKRSIGSTQAANLPRGLSISTSAKQKGLKGLLQYCGRHSIRSLKYLAVFVLGLLLLTQNFSSIDAQVSGDETIDSIAMLGEFDLSALGNVLEDPSVSASILENFDNGGEVDIRFHLFLRFASASTNSDLSLAQTSAYIGAVQYSAAASSQAASSSIVMSAGLQTFEATGESRSSESREPEMNSGGVQAEGSESVCSSAGLTSSDDNAPMHLMDASNGFVFTYLVSDEMTNPYQNLNTSALRNSWVPDSWARIPDKASYAHLVHFLKATPTSLANLVDNQKLTGWQFSSTPIPAANSTYSVMVVRFQNSSNPNEAPQLVRVHGIWDQTSFFILQVEIL